MRAIRSWLGFLGTLALAGLPAAVGAQPVGSEFQINTYTTSSQNWPSVASDVSGNFAVVWQSAGEDGSFYGVFGQRYDSAGVAQGDEFRVNTYTTNHQAFPSVASDAIGNFAVVWQSYSQDGSNDGIFGQRYDSSGGALGGEFRVNSYTTSSQEIASVASDASGNFVVVWDSRGQDGDYTGIFGQRYQSEGMAQGAEFRVNSYTTGFQFFPSVASDASGNFVVVWGSYGQDRSGNGVFGQRYNSGGSALGSEFRVNTYTTAGQASPSVASDANGNFVVIWNGDGQGDASGIFGQRYDNAGGALGSEFRINTYTTNLQVGPSVASDASGNFVVVWTGQDGSSYGVFGQRYDGAGVAQGDEFQVNSYTTRYQQGPSIRAAGTHQFVVAWGSDRQDGSSFGVFGQRYDFSGDTTPPSVTVKAPNGGEKLFTDSSYRIRWTAADDTALSSFDVLVSADGGGSFEAIAECQDLPGSERSCLWLAPGPLSRSALVRVAAEDTSGNSASDDSDAVFRIVPGAALVTVKEPNTNVKWRIGSLQTIRWRHNLGLSASFRIELDRDNDGTYEELIAARAPANGPDLGRFAWTVTGPASATARVRVSWSGNPAVSDASDVTFRITAGVEISGAS